MIPFKELITETTKREENKEKLREIFNKNLWTQFSLHTLTSKEITEGFYVSIPFSFFQEQSSVLNLLSYEVKSKLYKDEYHRIENYLKELWYKIDLSPLSGIDFKVILLEKFLTVGDEFEVTRFYFHHTNTWLVVFKAEIVHHKAES